MFRLVADIAHIAEGHEYIYVTPDDPESNDKQKGPRSKFKTRTRVEIR